MTSRTDKPVIKEGDVCPECGDGVIKEVRYSPFSMSCTHCGEWDENGPLQPVG